MNELEFQALIKELIIQRNILGDRSMTLARDLAIEQDHNKKLQVELNIALKTLNTEAED